VANPLLFTPFTLRGVTLRNRVVLSPMCQYLADDGLVNDWHLIHHGKFATAGLGLAFVEATAITRDGRITHGCTGLWDDAQIEGMRRIVETYHRYGTKVAVQLNHAGRKGSTERPWDGAGSIPPRDAEGPWETVGPSPLPGRPGWHVPRELHADEIPAIIDAFRDATRRALAAGFDMVEIHGAHGYLLHTFVSPLANRRTDAWGGDLARRIRLPLLVAEAVREVWPADRPVVYRCSVLDGAEGGSSIEDSATLARELKARGVDLFDCSSGGMLSTTTLGNIHPGPGHQVPLARAMREGAGMPTIAVGFITEANQAEAILQEGSADLIAIGRELIADPYWAYHAALALGVADAHALLPLGYAFYMARRAALVRPSPAAA
jgi:2,4-dienoyl-CoA reductase-like NADH-dependent reductase (Old Yellow Enzyme family)